MRDRSIRSVAVLLLATAACRPSAASTATPPEPPAPTTEPTATPAKLEGDAVVRVGAKLYLAPTGDEGFELRSLGPSPGLAVHIVGEEEGRVAIETVAASEHHCAAVLEPFEALRVRLFVLRADLVTVLTQDVEHAFDDGTKVILSRGTPAAKAGKFVARGTLVHVPVPSSRIGLAFSSGQPRAQHGTQTELGQTELGWSSDPLEYDGHTLPEAHLDGPRGSVTQYGAIERGDKALVRVGNPCLEVTASVALARMTSQKSSKSGLYAMKGPKDAVPQMGEVADRDGELGRDGVYREHERPRIVEPMIPPKHYDVKADTPIWSLDGRAAGKVVAEHRVALFEPPESDRRCFRAPMDRTGYPEVTLCFDRAALEEAPRTGYGSGGSPSNVPQVRQAKAEVKGALGPDIVRRIVRAHIKDVQYCYTQGLVRDPKLAGRVAISFTVQADGSVTTPDVAETSLGDANVGECIRMAVKRWKFPKPEGGGIVQITYPFVLEPG